MSLPTFFHGIARAMINNFVIMALTCGYAFPDL